MGSRRTTFQDPETGRWTRRCCDCKQTKDLERDFYPGRREPQGPSDWNYQCKACKSREAQARDTQLRQDPEKGPELRALYARLQRQWRERNPESYREGIVRSRKKLRNDPARWARHLENQRIGYRLRAEREGRTVRGHRKVTMVKDQLPALPAKPLADLLDALAAQRGGKEALGRELGFHTRRLRDWREGVHQTVDFDVADRVLTAAGVLWWEVWTREECPEVYEAMGA